MWAGEQTWRVLTNRKHFIETPEVHFLISEVTPFEMPGANSVASGHWQWYRNKKGQEESQSIKGAAFWLNTDTIDLTAI